MQKNLLQPLPALASPLLFFGVFSASALLFLFSFGAFLSALASLFFSLAPHFFFSLDVLPFFFQSKILFQPKTFFNPRYFFSPKRFSAQKSLPICGSAPPSFLLFFLFQRFFFFLVLFSAPTFVSV